MTPYLNPVTLLVIDLEDVARLSRTGIPVDKAEPVGGVGRGRDGGPVDADFFLQSSGPSRSRLGSGMARKQWIGPKMKKNKTRFCKTLNFFA